jgi:hypothetical protein
VRWTVFKSQFCGFAAQKYSTKLQLKNCRLARRYKGIEMHAGNSTSGNIKYRKLWKAFFVLLLCIQLTSYFLFHEFEFDLPSIVGEFLLIPLLIVSVFGYAFQKRVLWRNMHILVIALSILYEAYTFQDFEVVNLEKNQRLFLCAMLIPLVLLYVATYYAAIKYALFSSHIWKGLPQENL